MPLGQGVGDRVDAAVQSCEKPARRRCFAMLGSRAASLTNWVSRSTDGSGCPRAVHRTPTGAPRTRAAPCVPGDRTVRRSSVSARAGGGSCTTHPAAGGGDGGISQRHRGSDRLHHWEAEQGPGRAAAPASGSTSSGVTPTACAAHAAGPPTPAPQSSSDSSASDQLVDQPVHRQTAIDRNSLSNAPNSPSSVPRLRARKIPDTNHRAR